MIRMDSTWAAGEGHCAPDEPRSDSSSALPCCIVPSTGMCPCAAPSTWLRAADNRPDLCLSSYRQRVRRARYVGISCSCPVPDVMSCSASLLRRRLTGGRMLSAVHLNVEVRAARSSSGGSGGDAGRKTWRRVSLYALFLSPLLVSLLSPPFIPPLSLSRLRQTASEVPPLVTGHKMV
ncbi:hypothetical protein D4764_20G0000340 [Takifugu flavidus]|uniref:Uncharacterized protein n=1 Tax=Takifugu flavidus TaxID=433684 RepID=A0A5C6NER8_9TELE|nr:hypothetical protein D4764_20G0000340 [Takifugu flavidus]